MKVISTATVITPPQDEGEEPKVETFESSATVPPAPAGQSPAFVAQSAVMNILNSQLSGLAQAEIVPTAITIRFEQ